MPREGVGARGLKTRGRERGERSRKGKEKWGMIRTFSESSINIVD